MEMLALLKSGAPFGTATEWLLLPTVKLWGAASLYKTWSHNSKLLARIFFVEESNLCPLWLERVPSQSNPVDIYRGAEWPCGWVSTIHPLTSGSSGITPSMVWGKCATCVNRRPIPTHEKEARRRGRRISCWVKRFNL
jgi:hypothetical protein